MSNQINLEAGQWYKSRLGKIWYCVGNSGGRQDNPLLFICENRDHNCDFFRENGWYTDPNEKIKDLIEHLPDCDSFDWKPKPKPPKYRPFRNAKEFELEREKWLRHKQDGYITRVMCCTDKNVWLGAATIGISYKEAFDKFFFLDGTPFGVLESSES